MWVNILEWLQMQFAMEIVGVSWVRLREEEGVDHAQAMA